MNNNNDLFNMFGVEEPTKPVENANSQSNQSEITNNNQYTQLQTQPSEIINNNQQTQPSEIINNNQQTQPSEIINNNQQTQSQQINNTNEVSSFIKPIPDEIMQEINSPKANKDKEMLKLYIGQNYESLAYGGFSFCTFFFGPSYLVYRKQYGSAFILFILNIALSLSPLMMESSVPLILLIINFIIYIYFSVSFKTSYVAKAKETIDRIMFQKLSIEEKQEMIKKAGGIDNRAFIFYILTIIVNSVISYFVLLQSLF